MTTSLAPVSLGAEQATRLAVPGYVASAISFPAGLVLDAHAHDGATLAIVVSGGFEGWWAGHAGSCPPGTLVVEPAGELHTNRFATSSSSRIAIVQPSAEEPGFLRPRSRRATLRPDALAIAGRLMAELRRPDDVTPLAVEGMALEIAAIAARESVVPQPRQTWVRRAASIIEERHAESLTLSGLADEVRRHPAHLARSFRAAYGRPVGTYLREVRLRRAAEQLAGSDVGIAEIALRVGFVDQSHLTRWFVRYLGVTPGTYRALLRDE